jgi:benzylsuccinate CoA-transferase BbsE subunit
MPRPPPVTSAVRPLRSKSSRTRRAFPRAGPSWGPPKPERRDGSESDGVLESPRASAVFSDIRVLDLSDESGALAGKILADLGADVIAVEPPGGGPGRRPPFVAGDPEWSIAWLALHTSQRGLTLDWASDRGRALLLRLLERADVLIETEPPGRLEQIGLGDEVLAARFPRLVHCSITPFGRTGPWAHWRAGDLALVALGGNASMTGDADRPPVRCTLPTSFLHAGPEAATGIAAALYAREDSGHGQHVDVSLHECQATTLLGASALERFRGPGQRGGARLGRTREIWRAADGWISFGLRGGPARIPNLVATVAWMEECGVAPAWLNQFDWAAYRPHELADEELARLEDAFAAFFAARPMRELYEGALARRILLAPCNDAAEIAAHPQLASRGFFEQVEVPVLGRTVQHPGSFVRTGEGDLRVRGPAPRIGEHNDEVYGELGLSSSELAELRTEGVI